MFTLEAPQWRMMPKVQRNAEVLVNCIPVEGVLLLMNITSCRLVVFEPNLEFTCQF